MRRPLFIKLFLSVCVSFIVVSYFVWLADALLSQSPSRATLAMAETALAGADLRRFVPTTIGVTIPSNARDTNSFCAAAVEILTA